MWREGLRTLRGGENTSNLTTQIGQKAAPIPSRGQSPISWIRNGRLDLIYPIHLLVIFLKNMI